MSEPGSHADSTYHSPMHKHQLLFGLMISLAPPVLAQKALRPERPWSLCISAGPSIPIGSFGSTDLMNSDAGSAQVGTGAEARLTHGLALRCPGPSPGKRVPVYIGSFQERVSCYWTQPIRTAIPGVIPSNVPN